jgi:hypothetical protein
MSIQGQLLTENEIILMLQKKNPLVWGNLYDKYAAAMFGLICNLTEDKLIAEDIFIKTFVSLKETLILTKIEFALYSNLLRFTHFYATTCLKDLGLTPNNYNPYNEINLIHHLTTQCNSIDEAALMLNITVKETKKKLRADFLAL